MARNLTHLSTNPLISCVKKWLSVCDTQAQTNELFVGNCFQTKRHPVGSFELYVFLWVDRFGLKLSTVGCFCLSVTHRKSLCLSVNPQKVVLVESYPHKNLKLQSYPQKDVFVLLLPTQKRFASKLPTENRNCLSLPTKVGFFEKVLTEEQNRLGATHIWI